MTNTTDHFYGKYRGVVSDINDPLLTGRIKATVPDVLGDDESGWALPCAPFGGSGAGFFMLPVVGAGVWIEFEHGDPDFPIWSGCFFGSVAEMPTPLLAPPYKKVMIVTPGGHSIVLDDTPGVGGITLQTADGAKLQMGALGITLDNGKGATIALGPGPKVAVNKDALEVLF